MHSSIISKIRILKPRKKAAQPSGSFTIANENFHSSLIPDNEKNREISPPPPLINQNNDNDTTADIVSRAPAQKWLPVYIVNVQKPNKGVGGNVGTNETFTPDAIARTTSNEIGLPTSSGDVKCVYTITTRSKGNIQNKDIPETGSIYSGNVAKDKEKRSAAGRAVSCFLCPEKFQTVEYMQNHYLDKHKHKKRSAGTTVNNSKPTTSKKFLKQIRPKDTLDYTDGHSFGEGEPKCPICSIYFKSEDEVREHMTSVHCYKCSECSNTFYTLYQFTDHKCTIVNKQRKAKVKKKRGKGKLAREKDPLSLSPTSNEKEQSATQNTNVYPLVPCTSQSRVAVSSSLSVPTLQPRTVPTSNIPSLYSQPNRVFSTNLPAINSQSRTVLCSGVSTLTQPRTSALKTCLVGICANTPSVDLHVPKERNRKSLQVCSLEELTSEEFNKLQLQEILKNPALTITLLPKSNSLSNLTTELYSCGRCNVLCENKEDYLEHIEECLRLSNVSLISVVGPPQRLLKLKTENSPLRSCNFSESSINDKLLKELRQYIDKEQLEHFNVAIPSHPVSKELYNNVAKDDSFLFHPDIKGNISIKKINRTCTQTMPTECNSSYSGKSNGSAFSGKQPMVIIPLSDSVIKNVYSKQLSTLNSSTNVTTSDSANDYEDHYPEISIIDKSNHVTYNFIGSKSCPVLRFDPALQRNSLSGSKTSMFVGNNETDMGNKQLSVDIPGDTSSLEDNYKHSLVQIRETLLKQAGQLKSERSASSQLSDSTSPKSVESEPKEEKCSSLDLILDEEEIKMEVEDEIVDDSF